MFEIKVGKIEDNSRRGQPIVVINLGVFRKGSNKKSGNIPVEINSSIGNHPISAQSIRAILKKPNADKDKKSLQKYIERELISNSNFGYLND